MPRASAHGLVLPLPQEGEIRMRARYVGRCSECDNEIGIGEEIFYTPAFKRVRHADEDGCYSALDHVRQQDADLWTEDPDLGDR